MANFEPQVAGNEQEPYLAASKWMRYPELPFDIYRDETNIDWIPHAHDFYEIVIILQGVVEHVIYGNVFHASAGDVFCIPPDMIHSYRHKQNYSMISILLNPRFFPERFTDFAKTPEYMVFMHLDIARKKDQGFKEYLRLVPLELIRINDVVRKIEQEIQNKNIGYVQVCECGILEIMVDICRSFSFDLRSGTGIIINIARVITFLNRNYHLKITIDDLSAEAVMSKRSFLRHFFESTGETPMKYLLKVRMQNAQYLLKTTELAVTEIAGNVGFEDSSHFTQVFKQQNGYTPLQYRKTQRITK